MITCTLFAATTMGYAEGKLPDLLTVPVQILWFTAGAAMLVFTAFIAVLLFAGIGFRVGPRTYRRRPAVVFGTSTVIVGILAATGNAKNAPGMPNKLPPIITAIKLSDGARLRALL